MQPWLWWVLIFILLFVIPARMAWQRRQAKVAKRNRIRRRKGENIMNELIKSYIGKEVIIWAGSSSGVTDIEHLVEEMRPYLPRKLQYRAEQNIKKGDSPFSEQIA